jgi:hypothetical protein
MGLDAAENILSLIWYPTGFLITNNIQDQIISISSMMNIEIPTQEGTQKTIHIDGRTYKAA